VWFEDPPDFRVHDLIDKNRSRALLLTSKKEKGTMFSSTQHLTLCKTIVRQNLALLVKRQAM
jgi:hypothetical protein